MRKRERGRFYGPLYQIMKTLEQLQKQIDEYVAKGYKKVVEAGVRYSQIMTRAYIARTHASTGFGGKNLIIDESGGKRKTVNQIIKGRFNVNAMTIESVVYANYLARWYNTGAKQHMILRGPYKGRLSTYYPPRGKYFEQNRQAIENYFCSQLEMYMATHIKLGR